MQVIGKEGKVFLALNNEEIETNKINRLIVINPTEDYGKNFSDLKLYNNFKILIKYNYITVIETEDKN